MTDQIAKARSFRALHERGKPLVLYNIWDAGGAKTLADAGAPAVATGSWSVAAAHGHADGEAIPLDFLLMIVDRIVRTVACPVTVDFEGGYAVDPDEIAGNVRRLVAAGAVGINFEDQVVHGPGLNTIPDQTARIAAIRKAADDTGIPLFINARTDVFLKAEPGVAHASLMGQAVDRLAAYTQAGADGFFVPGLADPDLIRTLCAQSSLPVNVMMMGDLTSVEAVAGLGVARASYGPAPYIAAQGDLVAGYNAALSS